MMRKVVIQSQSQSRESRSGAVKKLTALPIAGQKVLSLLFSRSFSRSFFFFFFFFFFFSSSSSSVAAAASAPASASFRKLLSSSSSKPSISSSASTSTSFVYDKLHFSWETEFKLPKQIIKIVDEVKLRKYLESENLRLCSLKAQTQCQTQFQIQTFLSSSDSEIIPVELVLKQIKRDRVLYDSFVEFEMNRNAEMESLKTKNVLSTSVAIMSSIVLAFVLYLQRATGIKIPINSVLFQGFSKKSSAAGDDIENKSSTINLQQIKEDAKQRARRLEDAISNLKKNDHK
jgi:hypothetical protein